MKFHSDIRTLPTPAHHCLFGSITWLRHYKLRWTLETEFSR